MHGLDNAPRKMAEIDSGFNVLYCVRPLEPYMGVMVAKMSGDVFRDLYIWPVGQIV